jgi:hypothetical protein
MVGRGLIGLLAVAGCDAATSVRDAATDLNLPTSADQAMLVDAAAPQDSAPAVDLAPSAPSAPTTYTFTLDAGAFPPTTAHPSVLVYIPSGFDATPPLSLVVYIHGFDNCVENIVRDAGQSCDADAGTPVRSAYALAAQLEASHKNALLICPEVAFDQRSGATGNLGVAGGFLALLGETLADLAPALGPVTVNDVGTVVVASHSGGYTVAEAIINRGGVPVDELYLFDSLYGLVANFEQWIDADRTSFAGAPPARRFANVYTCCGGTLANSQAMADWAAAWVPPDAGMLVDDRTTSTWPLATFEHGLLFKLSALPHDGVPAYYFKPLLSTSQLPDKP